MGNKNASKTSAKSKQKTNTSATTTTLANAVTAAAAVSPVSPAASVAPANTSNLAEQVDQALLNMDKLFSLIKPSKEQVDQATASLSDSAQAKLKEYESNMTQEQAMLVLQKSKEQELNEFLDQQLQFIASTRAKSRQLLDNYHERCQSELNDWMLKEQGFLDTLASEGEALCQKQLEAFKQQLQTGTSTGLKSLLGVVEEQEKIIQDHFGTHLKVLSQQQQAFLDTSLKSLGNYQKQLEAQWKEVDAQHAQVYAQRQSSLDELAKNLEYRKQALDKQAALLDKQQRDFYSQMEIDKQKYLIWQQSKLSELSDFVSQVEKQYTARLQEFEFEMQSLLEEKQKLQELLLQKKAKLDQRESKLKADQQEVELARIVLKRDHDNIQNEIQQGIQRLGGQQFAQLKRMAEYKDLQMQTLESDLKYEMQRNVQIQNFIHQFGDKTPEQVLQMLKDEQAKNLALQEQVANSPSVSVLQKVEVLTKENKHLQALVDDCNNKLLINAKAATEASNLQLEVSKLRQQNQALQDNQEILEQQRDVLKEELDRYRAQHGTGADRDKRIAAITKVDTSRWMNVAGSSQMKNFYFEDDLTELDWLELISMQLTDNEFIFPKRIIYAFHTSLKSAEWSPLTVLAGVSGTGKSELPTLYSKFGGINFMLLPVQPNWDCQEAMLGFFNSIDNVFEPQPVLRFLAQAQDRSQGAYGLSEQMNLILLDEMNLAHIELYFAEFLSKLEARRGRYDQDIPMLDVKLGSGLEPYHLPLGRNVLWAGTMNQDETTKALSDKVIDRSNILYFPRPTSLYSRENLRKPTEIQGTQQHLRASVWQNQWVATKLEFGKEIEDYRAFLELINQSLDVVGRALGHRVWQSVESYMANYPTVRLAQKTNNANLLKRALHIAFEDQLVMKVMPKLRGIETRGIVREECLDPIGKLLEDYDYHNLKDDFTRACEGSYGQFAWSNSTYLERQGDDVGLK